MNESLSAEIILNFNKTGPLKFKQDISLDFVWLIKDN